MKKKSITKLLALMMVFYFIFTQPVMAASASSDTNDIEYLKSVMEMIKEKYKGQVTDQQLMEGALKGMFGSMDPYTQYFNPQEAKAFFDDIGGTYVGIGILMSKMDDAIVVTKVFAASPAEKAGILVGDKIVAVDGKSVVGSSLDEVGTLVRGEENTKVKIGIIKSDSKAVTTLEIVRAEVKLNPITYEIKNDIGYIHIDMFNANTYENIKKVLGEMDERGIKKIILDLRDNPGGEVAQAVGVAQYFVPEGVVTKLDFKSDDTQDKTYVSKLKSVKYKLAVLVNGRSASASEILAGAVQDTKAGVLVGTKTYGKGVVQTTIPLLTPEAYEKYEKKLGHKVINAYDLINKYKIIPSNSDVMGWTKITTAEYLTPKGRMIDKQGLVPDVQVDDPELPKEVSLYGIQKLQKSSKTGLNGENMDVYNAEKILKLSGYDVDTPDMKLDEKTFKAIVQFQKDKGGYPGGVLDFTTQQWLNEKLDQLILQYDKQYQKAVELLNNMN